MASFRLSIQIINIINTISLTPRLFSGFFFDAPEEGTRPQHRQQNRTVPIQQASGGSPSKKKPSKTIPVQNWQSGATCQLNTD
jgi:hypothetical protein